MKAIAALLDGLVDYAGLFPPASEDMRPALESYASYLESSDKKALGRFIVPLSRLKELEDAKLLEVTQRGLGKTNLYRLHLTVKKRS